MRLTWIDVRNRCVSIAVLLPCLSTLPLLHSHVHRHLLPAVLVFFLPLSGHTADVAEATESSCHTCWSSVSLPFGALNAFLGLYSIVGLLLTCAWNRQLAILAGHGCLGTF